MAAHPPSGRPGGDDARPRPASTLMVVRDGPHPGAGGTRLEVLMVLRNLRADFVGGAYVFPGGALDPQDGEAVPFTEGLDDAAASARLGTASGGLAYWVAAIRECFEEAGVLLARRGRGGPALSFADAAEEARFAEHRRELNARRRSFLEVLAAEGLVLALDRVHYAAHWITPEGSPRRYDTRFFVAAAPEGQRAAHDAGETVAEVWVPPADALARHEAGEMTMILPTLASLEALAAHADVAAALAAAAARAEVPSILPRVVTAGDVTRVLLPGDPGYDDPSLAVAGPSDLDEAVREARRPAT